MDQTKNINFSNSTNSIKISVSNFSDSFVKYPADYLNVLKKDSLEALLENFTFCRTYPLAIYFKKINYQGQKPYLLNLIKNGLKKDLPYVFYYKKEKTSELLKKATSAKISFKNNKIPKKILPNTPNKNNSILALSFGKDSLLTYALAKEVGLKFKCAFINDMEEYNPEELVEKKKIIKKFSENENVDIIYIEDNNDDIIDKKHLKNINETLAGTNAMLAFTLELLPVAYAHNAKYIIFGNEKNLDVYYPDKENLRAYPSYDQSTDYMNQENKYLKTLTNNNLQVISLIKPLYNLAEFSIISHRYPYLIQYLMTCDTKKDKGRACGECISCIWTSLFAAAFNIPPKDLGLDEYLFDISNKKQYTIFNSKINKVSEMSNQAKDEQLLAFLLAYKNGIQGDLIDLFKNKFLKQTLKREKALRKKFFSIYNPDIIPVQFRKQIVNIYKEELSSLSKI